MKRFLMMILMLVMIPTLQAASIASVVEMKGKSPYWGPLVGTPTDPNDMMIYVITSDVIVDFLEFTTYQGNSVAGLRGVVVAPYLNNVTIRNGTFKDLTGPAIVIGEGCTNVTLDNLHILDCESGFLLEGQLTGSAMLDTIVINNCSAHGCNGVGGGIAYGLHMTAVNNFSIQHSTFSDNNAQTANNGFGVAIENSTNGHIHTTRFFNNGGNALGAGVALLTCDRVTFEDCIAKYNASNSLSISSTGCGFYIQNSNDTLIDTVHATHNSSQAGTAAGVVVVGGIRNYVQNSLAQANQGPLALGVLFNSTTQSLINNNELVANAGAVAYGLRDTIPNTDNVIIGNLAYLNTTSGYDVNRTVGTFPVASATAGDFSAITALGDYINILLN